MVPMPAMILAAESNSLKLNSDRVLALDRSVMLFDDVAQVLRLAQLDGQAAAGYQSLHGGGVRVALVRW